MILIKNIRNMKMNVRRELMKSFKID